MTSTDTTLAPNTYRPAGGTTSARDIQINDFKESKEPHRESDDEHGSEGRVRTRSASPISLTRRMNTTTLQAASDMIDAPAPVAFNAGQAVGHQAAQQQQPRPHYQQTALTPAPAQMPPLETVGGAPVVVQHQQQTRPLPVGEVETCRKCSLDCDPIDDLGVSTDGLSIQFSCKCTFHIRCIRPRHLADSTDRITTICPCCRADLDRPDFDNLKAGCSILACGSKQVPDFVEQVDVPLPELKYQAPLVTKVWTSKSLSQLRTLLNGHYRRYRKGKVKFPSTERIARDRVAKFRSMEDHHHLSLSGEDYALYELDRQAEEYHIQMAKLAEALNYNIDPSTAHRAHEADLGAQVDPRQKRQRYQH